MPTGTPPELPSSRGRHSPSRRGNSGLPGGKNTKNFRPRGQEQVYSNQQLSKGVDVFQERCKDNKATGICGLMMSQLWPTSPEGGSLPWVHPWRPSSSSYQDHEQSWMPTKTSPGALPFLTTLPVFPHITAGPGCCPPPRPFHIPTLFQYLECCMLASCHYHELLKGRGQGFIYICIPRT